jgi:Putative RNA methylase family UPF0020
METTSHAASRYIAYFTKGLADVVTGEISALAAGAACGQTADRFTVVTADAAAVTRLCSLGRTIDDFRLLVAGPSAIPDAESFDQLCAQAGAATRAYLAATDPARAAVTPWSVTISARTPSWRRGPGWDLAAPIAARLGGADLRGRSRAPVDLRIQADGEQAHISVSLGPRPPGKRAAGPLRAGALRPSVAAALVRLALGAAGPAAAARGLYDPCCGTGTIPAEALWLSLPAYASDIDPEAVALTTQRLTTQRLATQRLATQRVAVQPAATGPRRPAPRVRVFRHDVLAGPPRDVAARMVASNLPWGKQIQLASHARLFDAIAALTARAVAEGGASALLTTAPQQLVARIRRQAPAARITTRQLGLLGQTPTVVLAQPR